MTASVMTVQLASSAQYVLTNMKSGGAVDRALPPWLLSDHGQGGAHLWWLTLDLTHRLATKGREGQPFTAQEVYWFETLLRAVDRHVAERPSGIRLKSLTLIMRDELATEMGDPQFDRLREWEVPTWSQKLMAMLEEMPERVDLAAPFLGTLVPVEQCDGRDQFRQRSAAAQSRRSRGAVVHGHRHGAHGRNGATLARRGCCGLRTPASSG